MSGLDDFAAPVEVAPVVDDTPSAERHAIACVLCDTGEHRALDRMASLLTDADFADARHALLWAAATAVRERGHHVDGATIAEEITSRGAGGAAVRYLGTLASLIVDPSHCEVYARRVAERAYLRATEAKLREALSRARKPGQPLDVVSDVRAILAKIPDGVRGARDDSMQAGAVEAMEEIAAAWEELQAGRHVGARWGVLSLDGGHDGGDFVEGHLGGLFRGKLYILGGVPAAGKTTLAWQAVLATARAGGRVLVFSLEMRRAELLKRLAGQMCGIPEARLETGALLVHEIQALQVALNDLARIPVNVVNDARTLEEIRGRVLSERARGEVSLVVVDYLQLVRMTAHYDDGNRADEDRVQGMKNLAMDGGVPLLVISAMTKAAQLAAASGKVDSTGTKGAGAEYAADLVAFLVRTNPDDSSASPEVMFTITKRRGGPTGNVPLVFHKSQGRFEMKGGESW